MCSSRKYLYLPHRRDFFCKTPPPSFIHFFNFFGLIALPPPPPHQEIPNPSVRRVWIFSGPAHSCPLLNHKLLVLMHKKSNWSHCTLYCIFFKYLLLYIVYFVSFESTQKVLSKKKGWLQENWYSFKNLKSRAARLTSIFPQKTN